MKDALPVAAVVLGVILLVVGFLWGTLLGLSSKVLVLSLPKLRLIPTCIQAKVRGN